MDYVTSNKVNIRTMEDVKKAAFRVNPAHARELRDAVYPSRKKPETGGADDAPEFRVSENSRMGRWLKLWPWLAAVLSGVLATICFAPFEQTWVCWLALTPLLAAVWFSGAGNVDAAGCAISSSATSRALFFSGAFSRGCTP